MAFEREKPTITVWTIAVGVCVGILLADVIETITSAIAFYLHVKLEFDPAVKALISSAVGR